MQIDQLLQEATSRLKKAGIGEPEANVQFLLAHVLGVTRTWVLVNGSFDVSAADEKLFLSLLSRKENGVPLAHITGVQPFCGLDILVTPDTLIPRPETENLVEIISEKFDKKRKNLNQKNISSAFSGCSSNLSCGLRRYYAFS